MPRSESSGSVREDDGLFVERLQTMYDKSLSDLRTFAQRENRSFDNVRKLFEEMHCKSLFGLETAQTDESTSPTGKGQQHVQTIISHVSTLLQSLERVAGLQSFFLVVNPCNPADNGFLGGTTMGRNFWQGQRGCGPAGVHAFRLATSYSQAGASSGGSSAPTASASRNLGTTDPPQGLAGPSQYSAKPKSAAMNLKAEVYSCMRAAVRSASGVQNAEMKWSNHSQLQTYNIRLVGWPEDIPKASPSALNVTQNRRILEGLTNGTIHFDRVNVETLQVPQTIPRQIPTAEEDFFEGTIDFSGGDAALSSAGLQTKTAENSESGRDGATQHTDTNDTVGDKGPVIRKRRREDPDS